MRFLFLYLFLAFCSLLPLAPCAAQTRETSSIETEDEIEQIVNPAFPIYPIMKTAIDGSLTWNPLWPLEIPSDSFSLASGKAASIELDMGFVTDETFVSRWNESGQLVQFPLLNTASDKNLLTASVLYNNTGKIETITLSRSAAELVMESKDESGEDKSSIEIEILETKDEKPSLARIHFEGEYYFAVFHYWNDSVLETWYDADGNALDVFQFDYFRIHNDALLLSEESLLGNSEKRVTYKYNSWKNISALDSPSVHISVLYNDHARPKYLERIIQIEIDSSNEDEESGQMETRASHLDFQWDERNLLVVLKENDEDAVSEKRYEYTLDEKGNWIERREIIMIRQGAYLFPSEGLIIRRGIQYIDE